LEQVRVVYVKHRTGSCAGLAPLHVESLEAVVEHKTCSKVLRFNAPTPENVAALTFAASLNGLSQIPVNTNHL
jgi:hypothetical protein